MGYYDKDLLEQMPSSDLMAGRSDADLTEPPGHDLHEWIKEHDELRGELFRSALDKLVKERDQYLSWEDQSTGDTLAAHVRARVQEGELTLGVQLLRVDYLILTYAVGRWIDVGDYDLSIYHVDDPITGLNAAFTGALLSAIREIADARGLKPPPARRQPNPIEEYLAHEAALKAED